MKLGKEEIQKMVLGGLLLITLLYGYFEMLLGPLKLNQQRIEADTAKLTKQIGEARGQIRRTQEAETNIPGAERVVKQVKAMIPDRAPVAWFPQEVAECFKRQGVDKVTTRGTGEQPEKELPGFRRMAWSVDLPRVEFNQFAKALASFENDQPLTEIANLQIDAGSEDVEVQRASLNIRNLVTQ